MKISKEEWQQMNKSSSDLADLHERDRRGLPRESVQVKPLPDIKLGDEVYYPKVNHPKHYNVGKYETIDVIDDWNLDFYCGNVIKYIARHQHKEIPEQDIEKALWYLQRYLKKLKDANN